jgi:protein gp37
MGKTSIEWADYSWNPITGCSQTSAGCKNCYAKRMAKRLVGRYGYPADEPFRVTLHPERMTLPYKWQKPRRIFVCSMSDLFHKEVPDEFIDQVMRVIWDTRHLGHTYMALTKRAERLKPYFDRFCEIQTSDDQHIRTGKPILPDNLHLGVSVETDKERWRIEELLKIPAKVRFISAEPLLERLDIRPYITGDLPLSWGGASEIHQIIAGCESGPKARPSDIDWFRDLRDQCSATGVAFFLKQMVVGNRLIKIPLLDGETWQQMPDSGGDGDYEQ